MTIQSVHAWKQSATASTQRPRPSCAAARLHRTTAWKAAWTLRDQAADLDQRLHCEMRADVGTLEKPRSLLDAVHNKLMPLGKENEENGEWEEREL